MESFPSITWTESGQTPVLSESSSSRDRPPANPSDSTSTCNVVAVRCTRGPSTVARHEPVPSKYGATGGGSVLEP
jgi:hypothetical protein